MYNGHGDVTSLIDDQGRITAAYYYGAFVNIVEITGDADNPYRYAGYQYDSETGLYYLNSRMYDPITARFLQEDIYSGDINDPLSLNLYVYCHNEPIMYTDPDGHRAMRETEGGGIIVDDILERTSRFESDFWNDTEFFSSCWWQDPDKLIYALNSIKDEVEKADNNFSLISEELPQNMLYAIQASSAAKTTGILSDDTLNAVSVIQVMNNIKSSDYGYGSFINVETVDGMIQNVKLMNSGWRKPFTDIAKTMEQGHIAEGFLGLVVFSGIFASKSNALKFGKVDRIQVETTVANKGAGNPVSLNLEDFTKGLIDNKPKYAPDINKWYNKGGNISINDNGVWTYNDWEGNSVSYPGGYPDFKSAGVVQQEASIGQFQSYPKDFSLADELAPYGLKADVNTWHHYQDGTTMQEIDKILHSRFTHIGGMSSIK